MTVAVPSDAHTFSVHLGTQRDVPTPAPRAPREELSIYPWHTGLVFGSVNVLVLCEYTGVTQTKQGVDKWQWEKAPPKRG